MTDRLTTKLDRGTVDGDTQAAATAYLVRSGNADLLVVLGLAVDPERVRSTPKGMVRETPPPKPQQGKCPHCNNKIPASGVCRRGKACREAADPKRAGAGTAAEVTCDRPGCTTTVLGRSEAGARVNAELDGWLVGDRDGHDWCGPHRPDGEGSAR